MQVFDGELMLRYIKPEDIGYEWERVRAGLEVVKKATSDDWLPEDLYMGLRMNNAALHIGEDEHGDYLGFLILQLVPMYHGTKLHVLCAYSATNRPLMRAFLPQIVEIGAKAGAKKITFASKRDEWESASARLGFNPGQTSYEMDI